jgi:endonuclease-3
MPGRGTLAKAKPRAEKEIHSTGSSGRKSKSLVGMAKTLVDDHHGEVPADMDALTALPGVGRKTANVVLGHALGVPGLPGDRHVLRVSNRIGIAEGDDPVKVEQQLCASMPKDRWTRTSDTLILHGRRVCKPKPQCDVCVVRDECDYYAAVVTKDAARTVRKPRR